MSNTSLLEPCYILHTRPYRDTSAIVECFSQQSGKVALLAKGARAARSRVKPFLQPFIPLLISWRGRGELPLLLHAENAGPAIALSGRELLTGLYINELLMRVLLRNDAHPQLYHYYAATVAALSEKAEMDSVLRRFELQLLGELGYGIDFSQASNTMRPIQPEQHYLFVPESGFIELQSRQQVPQNALFNGADLLAIAVHDYQSLELKRAAKRLTRLAFAPIIGNKPLKSRELFYVDT